jgi:hypothetical protein
MQLTSTSTQRTYRYVRLSIVGAVVLLAVAIVQVFAVDGPITSVSAVYYTPARTIFTGVLFAVALALLALSGHSLEQALLDLAALFAPLIAIVPTPIGTGDVPGLTVTCPTPAPCVPAGEMPGIRAGMTAVLILAVLGVAAAIVLSLVQRTLSTSLGLLIAAAGVIVAGIGVWWLVSPESFAATAHLVATGAFFGVIAAVSVVSSVAASGGWRILYAAIAGLTLLDVALLLVVLVLRDTGTDLVAATGIPFVLIGESIALLLFAAFWVAQTVQNWNEVDPAFR